MSIGGRTQSTGPLDIKLVIGIKQCTRSNERDGYYRCTSVGGGCADQHADPEDQTVLFKRRS